MRTPSTKPSSSVPEARRCVVRQFFCDNHAVLGLTCKLQAVIMNLSQSHGYYKLEISGIEACAASEMLSSFVTDCM